jgi:hypothetical protein
VKAGKRGGKKKVKKSPGRRLTKKLPTRKNEFFLNMVKNGKTTFLGKRAGARLPDFPVTNLKAVGSRFSRGEVRKL